MDARRWPVREERLLTVPHYCELKAWKVTVVWIECHFLTPFQEGTQNKLLAQEKI